MKKSFILFLVAGVIAVCLYVLFHGEKRGPVAPTDLVSGKALAYLCQKDLGRLLAEFKESRLGKTVAGLDVVGMAETVGLPEEHRKMLQKAMADLQSFLESSIFKEVFSHEFSAALLPFKSPDVLSSADMAKHLLLIARPGHGTQLLGLIASGFGKGNSRNDVSYRDHTIRNFQLDNGMLLSAVAVQDLLLLSLDEAIIHDALDRYDEKRGSLSENERFRKVRESFQDPLFFCYIGMESLQQQMNDVIGRAEDGQEKDVLRQQMGRWKGMQAAGYGKWQEGDHIRNKGVLLVDEALLDPDVKGIYGTPPQKNATLAFVPQRVLAYYWINTLDFAAYWKLYREELQRAEGEVAAAKGGGKIQQSDFSELFSMLEKEGGLMIAEAEAKRFLPLPDFAFFFKLKEGPRFAEFSTSLLKKYGLQTQRQTYNGSEIVSLAGFSQGALQPVYTIQDQYVVAASSMEMLKEIIDTLRNGHGLAENPDFQKVGAGLTQENNSVCFLRPGELMHTVKGMVDWGKRIIAVRDQQDAKKLDVVVDGLVDPLLDGLSMYALFGGSSRLAPNRMTFESTTVIVR